jgi:hypothetical protein
MQIGVDADKNPPPPGMMKALPRCSNSSDLLVGQKVSACNKDFRTAQQDAEEYSVARARVACMELLQIAS